MGYELINIGTPNDNNGDTIRDAFKKSNDNDAYLKQKVDAFENSTNGVVSNNTVTILTPLDAMFSAINRLTGAIKIRLPQSWTNTMMTLKITIFEYDSDETFELIISGYNHTGLGEGWYRTSVMIIGANTTRDFTVRFGHDGVKSCIYIGELNSMWHYLQLYVSRCFFGFGSTEASNWLTGWQISLENSTFQNISSTHTNNLVQGK